MKELYTAPELELLCLAPQERLASDNELEFDELMGGSGGGVSADPNVDIDVPIIRP